MHTKHTMVGQHNVSRGEGDGAGEQIDDKYDGEEYASKDQRANTRTTFYERDIDNLNVSERRKEELRRILRRQEGQHVNSDTYKSRGQQNYEEDKRRIVGVFASQLELTRSQKQRCEHLMLDVLSVNSFGQYSMEQVSLAVVNVVAREDGRWIEDENQFRDLMDKADVQEMDTMKRLRSLVRERLPSK